MKIRIPENAKRILATLSEAGYEGYVVGGCVRDSLLGREPQDFDITTSAKPNQVKELFQRTIDTGLKHGTVTVMMDKEAYEVTTYRIDGAYEDGRHPSEVIFTPSLEEDLRRRDFTINAMAYNEQEGLKDLFGGLEDLKEHRIRCVGEAHERFEEDALRMLRAVRFSAQLGYEIEEQTQRAIQELSENLRKISAERIQAELVKLLVSDHPEKLRVAYQLGITRIVLPEFDKCMETPQNHPHHCYSVGEHILVSVCGIKPRKELRLTMLFHDIGKPVTETIDEKGITHFHGHPAVSADMAVKIMKRLRFDNDTIQLVEILVRNHDIFREIKPGPKAIRRLVNRIGERAFPMLFDVREADVLAQSTYQQANKLRELKEWRELYKIMKEEQQCVSLKSLAVDGGDLIALGIAPGKGMGGILQQLLEEVLEEPERNRKEYLLQRAKELDLRQSSEA